MSITMPTKKCKQDKSGDAKKNKEYICDKCSATSNKKEKLCKPKKLIIVR